MPHPSRQKPPLCNEIPTDCHFEVKSYPAGVTLHSDDRNSNYLIFCQSGHVRITSTLFYDEILCAGEVMFVPRTSEWSGVALSDTTFIVHRFNRCTSPRRSTTVFTITTCTVEQNAKR